MDEDGTNHASIPQRIQEDLLDRYDITYAILMGNDVHAPGKELWQPAGVMAQEGRLPFHAVPDAGARVIARRAGDDDHLGDRARRSVVQGPVDRRAVVSRDRRQ